MEARLAVVVGETTTKDKGCRGSARGTMGEGGWTVLMVGASTGEKGSVPPKPRRWRKRGHSYHIQRRSSGLEAVVVEGGVIAGAGRLGASGGGVGWR